MARVRVKARKSLEYLPPDISKNKRKLNEVDDEESDHGNECIFIDSIFNRFFRTNFGTLYHQQELAKVLKSLELYNNDSSINDIISLTNYENSSEFKLDFNPNKTLKFIFLNNVWIKIKKLQNLRYYLDNDEEFKHAIEQEIFDIASYK